MALVHLSDLNITNDFGTPQVNYISKQFARGHNDLKNMKMSNATDIPMLLYSIAHHARICRTTVNDKAMMKNKDTQRNYLNVENIIQRLIYVFQQDESIVNFPDSNLVLYMTADVIQTEEANSGFIISNLENFLNKTTSDIDEDINDTDSKLPTTYGENMQLYKQRKKFITNKILTLNAGNGNETKILKEYTQVTSNFELAATHLTSMLSHLQLNIDILT